MKLFRICFQQMFLVGVMISQRVDSTLAADPLVFISSFASGDQGAIQAYRLDSTNGQLKSIHTTSGVENPFFIVLSKDQKFLYSIHASKFGGQDPEQVAAYALEGRTGKLTLLNRQSTRGTASCYLDIDATGKTVLVANYTTGNVASFPVRKDGSLGESTSFFQHTGSSIDPASVKVPAGSGPRHLTFHPNGKYLYAINELKNTVTKFDYLAETGAMTEQQTISTLPIGFSGTSYCADLKITPDGQFLYGTNRGHDSIVAYRIGTDGTLTMLKIVPSLGGGPQNLMITGDGSLLLCANMPGNNVAIFRINQQTGELKAVGEPTSQLSPSCIRLLP
jgi:6-phosphogluconolactonase